MARKTISQLENTLATLDANYRALVDRTEQQEELNRILRARCLGYEKAIQSLDNILSEPKTTKTKLEVIEDVAYNLVKYPFIASLVLVPPFVTIWLMATGY